MTAQHRHRRHAPGWVSGVSAAQRLKREATELCPRHARGLVHFSENWYLAQQAAWVAHMASFGLTPCEPKPGEPMDALVTVRLNSRRGV
jgi:hypothetical protein